MNNYKKLLLAISLLISATGLAQAENNSPSKNGPPPRPSFESIDINGDGEIDFDEFSSHKLPHGDHQTVFNMIDTDANGIISNEEFANHKPPQRKKHMGGQS